MRIAGRRGASAVSAGAHANLFVYVGPSRSISTRDTVNRGLDAVATTVIR
jgi:hypothetical protein